MRKHFTIPAKQINAQTVKLKVLRWSFIEIVKDIVESKQPKKL